MHGQVSSTTKKKSNEKCGKKDKNPGGTNNSRTILSGMQRYAPQTKRAQEGLITASNQRRKCFSSIKQDTTNENHSKLYKKSEITFNSRQQNTSASKNVPGENILFEEIRSLAERNPTEQSEYEVGAVSPEMASVVFTLIVYLNSAYCSDPHFSGDGGTISSNGFFLFRQSWLIDIFIVESCEWYH